MSVAEPSTTVAPRTFDRDITRLLAVVMLGAVMALLDTMIVNLSVPALAKHFDSPFTTIQWVLSGYTLASSVALPLTSWAVSRFGGKAVWIFSLALFVGGALLCTLAWSAASLIAFRVLQGLGGGMLAPTGQSMLASAAGPNRMGRTMGVFTMLAMIAMVSGPVIGGLIADNLDWHWTFAVHLPLGALALILSAVLLRGHDRPATRASIDWLGLLLLPPGVAALVYGLSQVGQGKGLTDPSFLAGVLGGAALIVAFVVHSLRRGSRALIDVRLLNNRFFATSVGAFFLYAGGVFGVMVLLPLYAQLVRGESALDAGTLLAPLGIGAMIAMPVAGRLIDRYGPRHVALGGVVLMILGTLTYTGIDTSTGRTLLIITIVVVGLGHGMVIPALITGSYRGLPPEAMPAATTSANIFSQFGGSAGVTALFVVLQLSIRHEIPGASGKLADAAQLRGPETVDALATAFARSFWWTIGLAVLALIPILLMPRRSPEPAQAGPVA